MPAFGVTSVELVESLEGSGDEGLFFVEEEVVPVISIIVDWVWLFTVRRSVGVVCMVSYTGVAERFADPEDVRVDRDEVHDGVRDVRSFIH
jgi:hypothetical protein